MDQEIKAVYQADKHGLIEYRENPKAYTLNPLYFELCKGI